MHERNPNFSTTQWSVVVDALHGDPDRAAAALQRMCSRYWYPIYAYLRRKGHGEHEAEDLTQGFFHFILARDAFQKVDRGKGRFRTFILAALTNFLHNERDRALAQKRGGQTVVISLDEIQAEEMYRHEPTGVTPERHFDRSWAATLARRVLDLCRHEHAMRGKGAMFVAIQSLLTSEPEAGVYERIGAQLEMESGAVKVALHRARRRFGELLRSEVAHTVSRPEDVEAELRELLATLAEAPVELV